MIGYLWAATGLTAATAAAALCLALLMARRLRELRELLDSSGFPIGPDLPEPGREIPPFTATTTLGDRITKHDLDGPDVVILFLMESCESCIDLVKTLRERSDHDGRPPIAVVMGDGTKHRSLIEDLEPVARVIEQPDDELASAFGVQGFPAVLLTGGGVIRNASHRLSDIPTGMAA